MKYSKILALIASVILCSANPLLAEEAEAIAPVSDNETAEPLKILTTADKGKGNKPATLLVAPKIEIKNTAQPNMNNVGVYSEQLLHLPDAIWKETDEQLALQLIQQLPETVTSGTLQRLIYKVLAAATITEFEGRNFVYLRAEKLAGMGQLVLARDLLERLPDSLVQPKEHRLTFLLQLVTGKKLEKELCVTAKEKISDTNNPFWQRWIILCQLKEGQKDRASLGVELLREQAALGKFYESMVWALLGNEPPRTVPEKLNLEMIAWLKFAGLEKLIYNDSITDPLVVGAGFALDSGVAANTWPQFTGNYSMGKALREPVEVILPDVLAADSPEIDMAKLREYKNKWSKVFLTHALRQAIDMPVDDDVSVVLLYHSYPITAQQLLPGWKKRLAILAYKGQVAQIIMTLSMLFPKSLEQYNLQDTIHVVELFKLLGMEKEAHMFAIELLESWKQLPQPEETPKKEKNEE